MVLMLVQQREGEEEGLMSCVYNMQRVKWKYGWWCLKACKLLETLVLLSLKMRHVAPTDLESSKESGSEPQTPLPQLKNLQGASPSSEVITLIYQDHSPRERPGLGSMTHTKPKTKESSNKSVSGPVTICDTEPVTSSVPTEVKINDQESKIDELTKLVQMLMNEKIYSAQKIQESKSMDPQPESSKSVNSSKLIQDFKPNGKNTDSSKLVRPKPLQKPKLKYEL
ncbi:hypothetical protein Tco_0949496, partial [Tanacetum coccineum]